MECNLEKKRAFALRIGFGLLANATLHLLHYQQGSNWVTDCMSVQFTVGTVCLAAFFSSSPSIHTFPSPLSSWATKQKATQRCAGGQNILSPIRLPPSLIMNMCPDQQTGILFWQSFEHLIIDELNELTSSVTREGLISSEGYSKRNLEWLDSALMFLSYVKNNKK